MTTQVKVVLRSFDMTGAARKREREKARDAVRGWME